MSSIGTGYDLSVSTYSPDGRLFQVEYANKAVEAAGYVDVLSIVLLVLTCTVSQSALGAKTALCWVLSGCFTQSSSSRGGTAVSNLSTSTSDSPPPDSLPMVVIWVAGSVTRLTTSGTLTMRQLQSR